MDALIRVADNAGDELALLSEWLRDEEELRGRVKIVHGPVRDTELGPVPELLSGALGARCAWERVPVTAVTRAESVSGCGMAVTLNLALALAELR